MPRLINVPSGAPRVLSLFFVLGLISLTEVPGALFPFRPTAYAATTFTVNSTGDGADSNITDGVCDDGTGHCTLRAAIQQANATPGTETINFSVTGTINLTGALPDINTSMTITGPGSGLLTVRRDTGGAYRIFNIGGAATVNITGLTVTNGLTADGTPGSPFAGRGGDGGGILNGGVLTLTDVVVTGNGTGIGGAGITSGDFGAYGGFGGGISSSGTLTMTNVTVSNNTTGHGGDGSFGGPGGLGGGIQVTGTLNMTHCFVTGNATGTGNVGTSSSGRGGGGGGIYAGDATTVHSATLNLTDTVVSGNHTGDSGGGGESGGDGGGIAFEKGTGTLTNCTVSGNVTGKGTGFSGQGGFGGGIFNDAILTVVGCTVSGNSTGTNGSNGGGEGGGVTNDDSLNMINSTISGNTTTGVGATGAGLWDAGTATLTNCTVAFNSATANTFGGAGIHIFSSSYVVNLGNTIVARNTLSNSPNAPDVYGAFTSQGHNLVGVADSSSTGLSNGVSGDQVGTSASPLDPKLGPLADNGGPTQTNALLSGSPALDAGDNSLAKAPGGNTLVDDQRGAGRFAASGGGAAIVDIGAYEFHPSLETVSDRTTLEDTPLSVTFDVGDGLSNITSVNASSDNQTLVPDSGLSVTGTGPVRTLQITPAANQNGTAHVTLTENFSGGGTSSQSFTLTVTPVNDAPTFTKGADVTVAEDSGPQTLTNWATGISAGPPDESGQSLTFAVTGDTNPSLFSTAPAVSPSGTLTFTSAPNANGSATITLVLKDDGGTANGGQDTSAPQSFKITVTPVNDPPTANNQAVTTSEDTPRFISLTGADVDGDPLTFSIVSGPSHGTLSGSGSGRTYTPAQDFNGSDSFTFKATDPSGADSAPATVSITVTAVNDPPVNTVPGPQATDQNAPLVFSAANSNAISVSDVDAGTDPVKVTLTATHGTLALSTTAGLTFSAGTGTGDATMTFAAPIPTVNAALNGLTFTPQAAFSGTATLQITTNDQGFNGAGGARSAFSQVFITVRPGTIEFSQSTYTVAESAGSLAVTVKRTGDTSQPATVDYATDDGSISSVAVPCSSVTGIALDRCDFTKAVGTLRFNAGEAEKSFTVLITDDSYVEGTETALLRLSNPTGGPALGSPTTATMVITDDAQETSGNPVDDSGKFVSQHYADFLNRVPDSSGLQFWTNNIESCGADQQCRAVKRVDTSAAFFLSIEFQQTGYLVERMYKVAYGDASGASTFPNSHLLPVPIVRFSEFLRDTQAIGQGVVVGQGDWQTQLENNKNAYAQEFVSTQRFTSAFPASMTADAFINQLNKNAGSVLTAADVTQLESVFGGPSASSSDPAKRAQVLRSVAENAAFSSAEFNRAFVLMQYFGYLRRNPDDAPDKDYTGYDFWLQKLNSFNGNYVQAEMVKAFITSTEYRSRFGN